MASRHSSRRDNDGQPAMGSIVGDFHLGQEIGRGSFAVVFKGHHLVRTPVPSSVPSLAARFRLLFCVCACGLCGAYVNSMDREQKANECLFRFGLDQQEATLGDQSRSA